MAKCIDCGVQMEETRENRKYLDGVVTLVDAKVRRCPECGEEELVVRNTTQLHKKLAKEIAKQRARLTPRETRFLRTHLGYSSSDFAALVGVDPSTVSRWENGKQDMSASAERLVRVMVLSGEQLDTYGLDEMAIDEPNRVPFRMQAPA